MFIAYVITAIIWGIYWKTHSFYSGYTGKNMNIMRTRTILIGMIVWPLVLVIKMFSGNLLR